ncbi:MAG: hypothetical protein JST28_23270 [Acidobacteria bacterium]|nr:hypothetical protein [Acidobacteriota bacterium]
MNYRPFSLLAAYGVPVNMFVLSVSGRRTIRIFIYFLLATVGLSSASAQSWSSFLDSSRAIDWTKAGFSIPNYSTNCVTQPTLLTGSSAASANASSIQNALASCDSTHNVVKIPAGTWYVAGITYPPHGRQVLRGAGPTSTKLISTGQDQCEGYNAGICMIDGSPMYYGNQEILSGGSQQCSWTAGYAKGSTTITLSNCGSAPPSNHLIFLDQANDSSDTGGVYVCDETTNSSCNYDGTGGAFGRKINGVSHSQVQATYVTGVTSSGGGTYTVTISPGVYFTNIRSSQGPGAWWSGQTQLNGLEDLTVDGSSDSNSTVGMYDCYQCWVKNVTLLNGARSSIFMRQSGFDVIRDSYFYQAQGHQQISYNIESQIASGFLIENNIMQQTTEPMIFNGSSGGVVAYNLGVGLISFPSTTWGPFASHTAGNSFNLWEGNTWPVFISDAAWGPGTQQTFFRNMLEGWMTGGTTGSTPFVRRSYVRADNIVGNVMGKPGYHNQYETYATSNSATTGNEDLSIYTLGAAYPAGCGNGTPQSSPYCDTRVRSTLMRWGNYDTVTSGVRWDSTEASPAAVTYASANFSSSYFGGLGHSLPSSLFHSSTPSWWPSGKPWPPIGPDVSGGNLGICSGSYSGSEATTGSQCSGGSLSSAWAGHANSTPALDCYLNVMHGPADGSGGALSFDANKCYSSSGTTGGTTVGSPTGLTAVVY